jgi:hypothetical protein
MGGCWWQSLDFVKERQGLVSAKKSNQNIVGWCLGKIIRLHNHLDAKFDFMF